MKLGLTTGAFQLQQLPVRLSVWPIASRCGRCCHSIGAAGSISAPRTSTLPTAARRGMPTIAAAAGNVDGGGSMVSPQERLAAATRLIADAQAEDPLFAALRSVQEEVADGIADGLGLRAARSPLTDDAGSAAFASRDGSSQFLIQALESGGKSSDVLWMVKPTTVIGSFGRGGRVNVYLGDGSYAPNLDVEVYHWTCTSLFVYLNLTPRRSLVDNPEDLDRFYLTPAPGGGPGMHGLYLQCEADPAFVPFRSKSAHVRALTGGTCLMYQLEATEENVQRVAEVTRRVAALWLAAVQAPDVPRPAGETEAAALAATNARLLHYSRLDPDAEKPLKAMEPGDADSMMALLCREPSALARS